MGWAVGLFSVLEVEADFDIEQKEYYVLRNRWAELPTSCLSDCFDIWSLFLQFRWWCIVDNMSFFLW